MKYYDVSKNQFWNRLGNQDFPRFVFNRAKFPGDMKFENLRIAKRKINEVCRSFRIRSRRRMMIGVEISLGIVLYPSFEV